MKFSYFHGTSTLFLKSILENGLGAVNPNIDHKNLELLKYIFGLCEIHLNNFEKYSPLIRDTTQAMVKQTNLMTNVDGKKRELNFKHQGIYVSLSEVKAIIYSVINKIGSEILERCHLLAGYLIENKVDFTIPKKIDYYDILNLNIQKLKPIVLKIDYIDDDNLIQENDHDPKSFLIELRKCLPFLSDEGKYELFQHLNFRIKKPIVNTFITPYYVEYNGELGKESFTYSLKKYALG